MFRLSAGDYSRGDGSRCDVGSSKFHLTAPGGRHTWTKKSPQAQGYLFIYLFHTFIPF